MHTIYAECIKGFCKVASIFFSMVTFTIDFHAYGLIYFYNILLSGDDKINTDSKFKQLKEIFELSNEYYQERTQKRRIRHQSEPFITNTRH